MFVLLIIFAVVLSMLVGQVQVKGDTTNTTDLQHYIDTLKGRLEHRKKQITTLYDMLTFTTTRVAVNRTSKPCPKQPMHNIINLAGDFPRSFDNEWAQTGALVIPTQKIVICSYPKAGSTTAKWIALAMLGVDEERSEICGNVAALHETSMSYWRGVKYLRNMNPPQPYQGPDSIQCSQDGAIDITDSWDELPQYFVDPSWTTVAFVRDPWYRSISMYRDQMSRGHLPKRWKFDSRKNFTQFVTSYTKEHAHWKEGFRHTGDAVDYCGLNYLKYDHYIDIDNIDEGLRALIADRPDLASYITQGWEPCTINQSRSLIGGVVNQNHRMMSFGQNVTDKLRAYDKLLCDSERTAQVYTRYKRDYEIFAEKLKYKSHICLS